MKRLILGVVVFLFMLNFIGCSKSGSEGAMTFSSDNVKELSQKIADAGKSMDPNMKQIDVAKTLYKDTINDMGYSLDATILAYIKYAENKNRTQRLGILINIFDPLEQFIVKNPKFVVDKDLVKQETVDRLLIYHKYRDLDQNSIQAIKYVAQCQKENNGNCTVKNYLKILLDTNFIQQFDKKNQKFNQLTVDNFWSQKNDTLKFQYESYLSTISIGKYVVYQNGSKIDNIMYIFENKNRKIKLAPHALKDLENYNPWWLK